MGGRNKKGETLDSLSRELTERFARWDYIHEHGCSDPFWTDGVNINLVRNHIIYYKRKIDEFLAQEQEEFTLFGSSYPDIYYRETPPEMPRDFMANADQLREKGRTQLALYEQNPDFCYIRDHWQEAFPHGETKATRSAGMYVSKFSRVNQYRNCVEQDDLVHIRSLYYRPYKEQALDFAQTAAQLRDYLARDHSHDDNTQVVDVYEEDELDECDDCYVADLDEAGELDEPERPQTLSQSDSPKPSLNEIIQSAASRTKHQPQSVKSQEEQLSFF